jgi:hypothetical protein
MTLQGSPNQAKWAKFLPYVDFKPPFLNFKAKLFLFASSPFFKIIIVL